MSAWVFALLALAGGCGAAARLLVDGLVSARRRRALPSGTIVINVSGSLLLGVVAGLGARGVLPHDLVAIIGAGFLGGFTTFSTAMVETLRLAQRGRWGAAAINALGVLVVAVAAAALGYAIAS